ncbi:MAG: hypothetical protein AUJ76_04110 [Candidatus Omnitrophica bacterium CG1_02_41_171]|nr:MAG: hypothetical protein AUJ76_04110 [Candidatus Omnitrophica bacterium CG1_02_41_171]PIW74544.1 MAG: hypothetical protein CO004_00115 [bacterium (Candidatus Ratteibacteria) CG_4_8_14_3_um_filter_41_36]
MSEKEFLYQLRLKILEEADKEEISISSLCPKHHVSRKWFYKWKKRREIEGDEGLRSKVRAAPRMPNKVPKEIEEQILAFVEEYPTYGPERTEAELKSAGICVGHTGIYKVLKKKGLNTAKSRLEWVRKLRGEVEDTFYIGCLKGIGRIYHQIGCDCFSSFGAAKVYDNKTTDASTDFVESHLVKKFAPVKIERILTDCGTEFTTWHEEAIPNHEFEKTCKKLGIKSPLLSCESKKRGK